MAEVIIMAQGTQARLGLSFGIKQLLRLPACGDVPIIVRTIRMLEHMGYEQARVTVVTWPDVDTVIRRYFPSIRSVTMSQPGNSSLRGVYRYLSTYPRAHASASSPYTAILLGDVVYSWACLRGIMGLEWGFVGTPDLSEGGGELWGVGWKTEMGDWMSRKLRDALVSHPRESDIYQPGQMRRWILGGAPSPSGGLVEYITLLRRAGRYVDIADYTFDVDLPSHTARLTPGSEAAKADDAANDMTWDFKKGEII